MAVPRIGGKTLTLELRKLGAEVHTILDDGTQVTKDEALAEFMWKKALGYTEKFKDDDGNNRIRVHEPAAWAMQYIWERREGKSPAALPDEGGGMKASAKVRELAKGRLNALAAKAVKPVVGPPTFKPPTK